MVPVNEIFTSIDHTTIQQYNQFIIICMGPLAHPVAEWQKMGYLCDLIFGDILQLQNDTIQYCIACLLIIILKVLIILKFTHWEIEVHWVHRY